MRSKFIPVLAAALGLILAGCRDNSSPDASSDASSLPEQQNTQVDADPTPDTGTGGESQVQSPDGTTK